MIEGEGEAGNGEANESADAARDTAVSRDEYRCTPCGEAEKVRPIRAPGQPSQKEIDDHELTHCPYRSWCDHCVRGQAKDSPHRTIAGEFADESIVRVVLDYCFFQEDLKPEDVEEKNTASDKMTMTVLVMLETLCHSIWAYTVRSKGASEAWVAEHIVEDMETVGVTEERLIVKADQEISITDVQKAVVKLRSGYGTAIDQSRVGDSNSNGKIERAIQDFKGLVRTLRSALEEKIGEKVHLDDAVTPWLVRHAAHLITRCRTRENGRTSCQLMKGRRSSAKMVPFCEVVLFKIPKTQQRIGDFEDRWEKGVWVGFVMRSGDHLVATSRGVFKASTVMRRTIDKRWSANLVKEMKGSPDDPVPGSHLKHSPAFAKKYEDPTPSRAVFIPMKDPETEVRAAYIYKKDIDEHGPTDFKANCLLSCANRRSVWSHGRRTGRCQHLWQ